MSFVPRLWTASIIVATLMFAPLIWLAGPFVFFGDKQPLESAGVRLALIILIPVIVFMAIARGVFSRRRAVAAALEKEDPGKGHR